MNEYLKQFVKMFQSFNNSYEPFPYLNIYFIQIFSLMDY